jgi:hypothetical protein
MMKESQLSRKKACLIDSAYARRNGKRSGVDGETSDTGDGREESSKYLLLETKRST